MKLNDDQKTSAFTLYIYIIFIHAREGSGRETVARRPYYAATHIVDYELTEVRRADGGGEGYIQTLINYR